MSAIIKCLNCMNTYVKEPGKECPYCEDIKAMNDSCEREFKKDMDELIVNQMVEAADEYYRTKAARLDSLYIDIAQRVSEMSFAKRRKVGAVVVKDNNILSFGWNGMPSGFNNICEIDDTSDPRVIHAEINAFAKLSRSTGHSEGATLYLTLSPCYDCAKMIIQSGIKRVVFRDLYRVADAIPFLEEAGVLVEQITKDPLQSRQECQK